MQGFRGFDGETGTDAEEALAPGSSAETGAATSSGFHRFAVFTLMVIGCVATVAAGGVYVFSRCTDIQFDSSSGGSMTELQATQGESNGITSLARDFHKGDTTMYVGTSSIFKEGQSFFVIAGEQVPVATVLRVIDDQTIQLTPTSDMINFDLPQYSSVVRPAEDISPTTAQPTPSPTSAPPIPSPTSAPPTPSPSFAPKQPITQPKPIQQTTPAPTQTPVSVGVASVDDVEDNKDDNKDAKDMLWISVLVSLLVCGVCVALFCCFMRKSSKEARCAVADADLPPDIAVDEHKCIVRTTYCGEAGDDTLEVTSVEGYQRGDTIEIASDGGKETGVIKDIPAGQLCIVLEKGLTYTHPPHATVSLGESGAPRSRPHALGDLSCVDKTTPAFKTPRRSNMIQDLFFKLDNDKDGYLNSKELLSLAKVDGFGGNDKEWAQVFSQFTLTHFDHSPNGCNVTQFTNLLNDRDPEKGMYLTDDEMERYLDELDSKQLSSGHLNQRTV